MSDYEAIVVGGGFAGVTAARELEKCDLRTLLLEARDRLGGRTWSTEFAGQRVELGGGWVHWRQPHVWAELTRYGLGIAEDESSWDVALLGSPPRRLSAVDAWPRLVSLFSKFSDGDRVALERPHDPLFHADRVAELDRLSLQDRMDQLRLSEEDQKLLSGSLYEWAGSPLDEASLVHAYRWLALAGWDVQAWYDDARYQLEGGTAGLIGAMLDDARPDVSLSSPVSEVVDDGSRVRVKTRDGTTVTALTVVVATPVNLWPTIRFSPPLSDPRVRAARQGIGKPHQGKVWAHVRGRMPRIFGQLAAPDPMVLFWTHAELEDGQIVVGFNTNPEFDVTDKEQVARVLLERIDEAEEVVAIFGQDWGRDEFSRGGNTYYRPGQLSFLPELQRPAGRLAFATADIANGFTGYIDGAIERGIVAARHCRRVAAGD